MCILAMWALEYHNINLLYVSNIAELTRKLTFILNLSLIARCHLVVKQAYSNI